MQETTYLTATGEITFNMTNDYMFRVVLQENEIVLRGLICSLLHLRSDDVQSVVITNPIVLGASINEKTFVLDVNVLMNNNTIINLEMQMENEGNWTDRSISYLCRNFTKLQKGQDYIETKPAIHIGFLNYTLFPEMPEFYATYQLLNVKNHHTFSGKLTIGVVDLNHTELATEEDHAYGLDEWVALFQSKTWEDLRMIAKEKPELLEATKTLYQYNNEETVIWECWAREDYEKKMNSIRRDKTLYEQKIAEQKATIEEKRTIIAEQEAELEEKKSTIAEQEAAIEEKRTIIAEQEAELEEKKSTIAKNEAELEEKNSTIEELKATIEALKQQLDGTTI